MLDIDIIATLDPGYFDLDDTVSMDPTQFGPVCVDQRDKTLRCHQITGPAELVRTNEKHFLDWSTRNQPNYSLQTGYTDEHRGESSYSRLPRGERFSVYRGLLLYTLGGF